MSVRQYIGARYVTKIYENTLDPSSAEWQASVNYEPLTMVTYNNGSYLSKKQVPASVGNPASNPTYWVQTGFYNGQIASLQAQIDTLNGRILPPELSDHKFLYVGDSMLGLTSNWGGELDSIIGLTDSTYVYEGGAGFHKGGNNTGKNFTQLVEDATIPDDVTDTIVYGGCNDCTAADYAYVINEIPALITAIKTKCPNTKIYVAFNATFTNGTGSTWDNVRPYVDLVYDAIQRATPLYNAVVIESASYACLNHSLTSDGTHPTSDGSKRIACAMHNELMGHSWQRPIKNAASNDSRGLTWYTCQNGFVTVQLELGGLLLNTSMTPVAITPNTNVDLGAIVSIPLYPRRDNQFSFDCNVRIQNNADDSYTYEVASCVIYHNGHIFINVHGGSALTAKAIQITSYKSFTVPVYS